MQAGGSRDHARNMLDSSSLSGHTLFAAHPQFSTHLPIFLLACRHTWRVAIAIVMIPHPISSLEPLLFPLQTAMCKNPLHTPRGCLEKAKGILRLASRHSGSSSHRFPGSQGLFLFCPQATLLNISWDKPIYHL